MFDLKKFLKESRIPLHEASEFSTTRTQIVQDLRDLVDRVQKATYANDLTAANKTLTQFSSEVSKLSTKWNSTSKKL